MSGLTVRDATAAPPMRRQHISFSFFAIDPLWRHLPPEERSRQRQELTTVLKEQAARDEVLLRSYSTVGTRGDADFLLWTVADDPAIIHALHAAINATALAGYLRRPYHYFSMTKRSMYVEKHLHEGQEGRSSRLIIAPSGRQYLFVYPFVKTRAWYRLPQEERQRQMDEHIALGHKYPGVKINTTYSFGLDDQEFVVAFESDSVADFLDLVQEMRESEASTYTVRDVPSFTCMAMSIEEMLAALG